MPVRFLICLLLVCLQAQFSIAQGKWIDTLGCARKSMAFAAKGARTTVADAREDDYDVRYVRFDLQLRNNSTLIDGSVSTTAEVVAATLSDYVFELDDSLQIDSVWIDGRRVTWQDDSQVHTAHLQAGLLQGSVFTATVFYHGFGRSIGSFSDPGFHNAGGSDL